MKVGVLFRKEVNLTYARIQDIHLRSGILQRWLGLANVQVQTASGASGPEMVIEGFKEFEEIRDFLYTRMRGYAGTRTRSGSESSLVPVTAESVGTAKEAELVVLLSAIRDELKQTRETIERAGLRARAGGE